MIQVLIMSNTKQTDGIITQETVEFSLDGS